MTTIYQYRVWCTDLPAHYEFTWGTTEPLVCPSNGGPIDTNLTTIVSEVPYNLINTGASYDAFGRLRVSELTTILDLKQTSGPLELLIDQIQSGTAVSTYNINEASTTLTTSANNDYAISQTFQRGQYQSGKSALVEMSFTDFHQQTNVTKRIGYFNSSTSAPYTAGLDGIFLESNDTGIYFKIYRNGVEIDSAERADWIDPADGTKACPDLDFSKAQIVVFDFQWLGVGRVAFNFVVGEQTYLVHVFPHSNIIDMVYMSYSNHSLRWELRQSGAGSGNFTYICSAFHTEGATNTVGKQFSDGTKQLVIDANTPGTYYAVVGLRLESVNTGVLVNIKRFSLVSVSNDAYLWELRLNPTVAGTFNYSSTTNSNVQRAIGDTSSNPSNSTVTGGTVVDSGYVNRGSGNSFESSFSNGIRLGTSINGTQDTFVLCVTPISGFTNMDIAGSLTWIESE